MFIKRKLNDERFNVQLYKGDSPSLPIDFPNSRKGIIKVQFRIVYTEHNPEESREECIEQYY